MQQDGVEEGSHSGNPVGENEPTLGTGREGGREEGREEGGKGRRERGREE